MIDRIGRRLLLCGVLAAAGCTAAGGGEGGSLAPAASRNPVDQQVAAFQLPAPTQTLPERTLWATYYHVWPANETTGGEPLRDARDRPLGPRISAYDWCRGAVEGTIRVTRRSGATETYNLDARRSPQVACRTLFPNEAEVTFTLETERARFERTDAPFGNGERDSHLVPFRSIAVDPSQIPLGTVLYVAQARGQRVVLPSGQSVTHDGYFFANDTGDQVNGNHVDVFGGVMRENPFPSFVTSDSTGTFTARVVSDPAVVAALARAHRWPAR